ncbi:MAG TPA: imidazole glycerol phosphate synthase subunit HisH [Bacteroidia bacterium]|nr:imidazole glycerol phosphate synthase subunit HisH [Bacteroidia bacterium]
MIVILKYNAGNVTSVKNAIERLGYNCIISDVKDEILKADKVIFPGVGEASTAMKYLKGKNLDILLRNLNQPVLGICLGQQLMCKFSAEGKTTCLGIFNSVVKKFPPRDLVPHMGWNNLTETKGELFKGITAIDDVYFVHSYYTEICKQTMATCDYILPFSAAIQNNNFYATQFHPEKSGDIGSRILKNFLSL